MLYNENESQRKEIKHLQDKLKHMNVSCVDKDYQLIKLKEEICKYQHKIKDLERKLIIEEAKVECVYEKKMVEETKVKTFSKKVDKLMAETHILNTKKNLLLYKVEGLENGLSESRITLQSTENELTEHKRRLASLNDIINELNLQLNEKSMELQTFKENYKKSLEFQHNINIDVLKGLHRLQQYSTKPRCFTSRKYFEKERLLNELKERVGMLLLRAY